MNSFWSNLACLRPLLLRRRPTKWRQQRRNGRRGLPSFGVPGFFFLALPFFGFVLGGRSAQAYRISTKTTGAELTPFFFTFFAIFCLFSREGKMRREKRTRNLHTHTHTHKNDGGHVRTSGRCVALFSLISFSFIGSFRRRFVLLPAPFNCQQKKRTITPLYRLMAPSGPAKPFKKKNSRRTRDEPSQTPKKKPQKPLAKQHQTLPNQT